MGQSSFDQNDSAELQNYREMMLNSQSQPSEDPAAIPTTTTPPRPPASQDPSQINTSPINLDYAISQASLVKTQPCTFPDSLGPEVQNGESQASDADLLNEVTAVPSHQLFDESARFGPDSPVPVTPMARKFSRLGGGDVPNMTQLFQMSSPARPMADSPAFRGSLPTPLRKLQTEEATTLSSPKKQETPTKQASTRRKPAQNYVSLDDSQEKRKQARRNDARPMNESDEFWGDDAILQNYKKKLEMRKEDEAVEEELRRVKVPDGGARGRKTTGGQSGSVPAEEGEGQEKTGMVQSPPPQAPVAKMVPSQAVQSTTNDEETVPDTDDEKDDRAEEEIQEIADSDDEEPVSPASPDWSKLPSSFPHNPRRVISAITDNGQSATIADSQPNTQASPRKRPNVQREATSEIPVDSVGDEVLLRGSPDPEMEKEGMPPPLLRNESMTAERVAETSPVGTAVPPVGEDEEERQSNQSQAAKKRKRADTTALGEPEDSPKRKKRASAQSQEIPLDSIGEDGDDEDLIPCSDEEENAERHRAEQKDEMDLDKPSSFQNKSSSQLREHPPTPTPQSRTARQPKNPTPEPAEEPTQPDSHRAEESQTYRMLTSPTTKRTPRVYGSNAKSGIGSKSTVKRSSHRTPLATGLIAPAVPATAPAASRSTRSTTNLRHSINNSGLFDSKDSRNSTSHFSPQSEISSFSTPLPNRQPSLPYLNVSTTTDASIPTPYNPNRVFALFKNTKGYHYPATYSPSKRNIVFDDGTVVPEDGTLVLRNLVLREGDRVKVTGMSNITWDVLKTESPPVKVEDGDMDGNEFVILRKHKSTTRKSVAASNDDEEDEIKKVKVRDLYLPRSLVRQFPPFLARRSSSPATSNRPVTRSSTGSTPTPATPIKSRMARVPIISSPSSSRINKAQDGPIFSHHLIALSLGQLEPLKKSITKQILDNGGQIIDSSFETLFNLPALTSPSTITGQELSLDEKEAKNIKDRQVVVVADKYCRRAKFLQALALGIPVLHLKWVLDCAEQKRLISWEHYQLPSGESRYLDGAIISRSLHFSTLDETFDKMIASRPRLLHGKKLLFVGKGEKRLPYWFLILAMDPTTITVCPSLDEARKFLHASNDAAYDYVYIDTPSPSHLTQPTAAAAARKNATLKARRSKANLKAREEEGLKVDEVVRGARVVDDEWVVQSLILGRGLDCF